MFHLVRQAGKTRGRCNARPLPDQVYLLVAMSAIKFVVQKKPKRCGLTLTWDGLSLCFVC